MLLHVIKLLSHTMLYFNMYPDLKHLSLSNTICVASQDSQHVRKLAM